MKLNQVYTYDQQNRKVVRMKNRANIHRDENKEKQMRVMTAGKDLMIYLQVISIRKIVFSSHFAEYIRRQRK